MAMAIALAAVAAQAEDEEEFEEEGVDVWVYISNVYRPGTSEGISTTAYLIFSDTMSQSDAVAAFVSPPSPTYLLASTKAFTTRYLYGGGSNACSDGDFNVGEMYLLCFDQDYNNMYVSPVANPQGGGDAYSYSIDAGSTSGALAKSASGGWQGAGWYAQSVPEPTSGLLMLLGVAGLALKRKRA